MLIREMTLEDIPQAVEIENLCFSMPWSEKSFEDSIIREDTLFLVSEESVSAVGDKEKTIPAENTVYMEKKMYTSDQNMKIHTECKCKVQDKKNADIQNEEAKKQEMKITGYIGMYLSFDEASITNVAVHPSYRKNGYGKELVSTAKIMAKEKQIERIFLEVRVSNTPALSLYQKMGFKNLGIRKNFYDHPKEDAYIMSCELLSCPF